MRASDTSENEQNSREHASNGHERRVYERPDHARRRAPRVGAHIRVRHHSRGGVGSRRRARQVRAVRPPRVSAIKPDASVACATPPLWEREREETAFECSAPRKGWPSNEGTVAGTAKTRRLHSTQWPIRGGHLAGLVAGTKTRAGAGEARWQGPHEGRLASGHGLEPDGDSCVPPDIGGEGPPFGATDRPGTLGPLEPRLAKTQRLPNSSTPAHVASL